MFCCREFHCNFTVELIWVNDRPNKTLSLLHISFYSQNWFFSKALTPPLHHPCCERWNFPTSHHLQHIQPNRFFFSLAARLLGMFAGNTLILWVVNDFESCTRSSLYLGTVIWWSPQVGINGWDINPWRIDGSMGGTVYLPLFTQHEWLRFYGKLVGKCTIHGSYG